MREAEAAALESEGAATLAQERSDCMAASGHGERGVPQEARSVVERDVAEMLGPDGDPAAAQRELAELGEREVGPAVADVTCQGDTDCSARLDRLVWAAHAGLVDRFAADLAALAEAHP